MDWESTLPGSCRRALCSSAVPAYYQCYRKAESRLRGAFPRYRFCCSLLTFEKKTPAFSTAQRKRLHPPPRGLRCAGVRCHY